MAEQGGHRRFLNALLLLAVLWGYLCFIGTAADSAFRNETEGTAIGGSWKHLSLSSSSSLREEFLVKRAARSETGAGSQSFGIAQKNVLQFIAISSIGGRIETAPHFEIQVFYRSIPVRAGPLCA